MKSVLVGIFIVLQILDIMTTQRILEKGGTELNPFLRWVMKKTKYWWIVKMVLAVISLVLCSIVKYGEYVLIGLVLMYMMIVRNNMTVLRNLKGEGNRK